MWLSSHKWEVTSDACHGCCLPFIKGCMPIPGSHPCSQSPRDRNHWGSLESEISRHVEGGRAMLPVWDHLHCYIGENKTPRLFKPLNFGVFIWKQFILDSPRSWDMLGKRWLLLCDEKHVRGWGAATCQDAHLGSRAELMSLTSSADTSALRNCRSRCGSPAALPLPQMHGKSPPHSWCCPRSFFRHHIHSFII